MALTDYAQFKTLVTAARRRFMFHKSSLGNNSFLGQVRSFFSEAPLGGTTPTTAVACGRSLAGNLHQIPQPFSVSAELYLAELQAAVRTHPGGVATGQNAQASLLLVDRLSHQGGLSGTVTTEQTTNLPTAALTRYASGEGVMIGLLIYTAVGSTNTTATVRYTNQAGTGSRTTKAVSIGGGTNPTTPRQPRTLIICPLQDGDTGVQSVEGVTLAATTGTAGNFGVVLFKPLGMFPATTGPSEVSPYKNTMIGGGGGLEKVDSDACLELVSIENSSNATTTMDVTGAVNLIEVP